MTTITKPCLAPYHPFKQATFKYHGYEGESENYCSSCAFYARTQIALIQSIIIMPRETLYGNKTITLSREDAHALLDQAYDEEEKGA